MLLHTRQLFLIVTTCAAATVFVSLNAQLAAQDSQSKAQSDAIDQEPARKLTTPTLPSTDTAAREEASEKRATKRLERRAGEQIGEEPRGRAQMLGMSLQEADNGRVKVVEVSPTSPAFQSGVKVGDEIISYQGLTSSSYRKMIDGMRRLTTEATDGTMMALVVQRDGKRTALRVRNPVTLQRTVGPRPEGQPANLAPAPGQTVPDPTAQAGIPAGGNDVNISNVGPFADFFGGQGGTTESVNERAMAEITQLNAPPQTARQGDSRAQDTAAGQNPTLPNTPAAPANGGMRIGLAGFRDDPSGMVVMVDVGALAPGNYTVGISDPSVIGASGESGTATPRSNVGTPRQADPPLLPLPAPEGTKQPQGNLLPTSRGQIPRTVLAQVAQGQPAEPAVRPTGQVDPAAPAPRQADPPTTTPAGTDQGNAPVGTGAASGTMLNEIGTITVDQSGTGRMQKTVEGIQVRNVVGQAIVIYSQGNTQTTVPANLNGTAGAATRQGVVDSTSARGSQQVVDGTRDAGAAQDAAAGRAAVAPKTPVAAGIIRLISDRRPPTSETDTAVAPTAVNPGIQQPASATPAAGQNPVR